MNVDADEDQTSRDLRPQENGLFVFVSLTMTCGDLVLPLTTLSCSTVWFNPSVFCSKATAADTRGVCD